MSVQKTTSRRFPTSDIEDDGRGTHVLAETLAERAARFETAAAGTRDPERGARRLEAWIEEAGFGSRDGLAARLEEIGLDVHALRDLLGGPPRDPTATPPAWWRVLRSVFQDASWPADAPVSFLTPLHPLLAHFQRRLQESLERLGPSESLDLPEISQAAFSDLIGLWMPMVRQTLILEMHIAKLEEALEGDTPEARFVSFAARLSAPGPMLDFFEEYPVLGRLLVEAGERWLHGWTVVLTRFVVDRERILAHFAVGQPGPLQRLEVLGDRHRGGQAVMRLGFASGFELIYKPRSLAIEAGVQEVLERLNAAGVRPEFPRLEILDRGPYGWVEAVQHRPCTSPEEAERFDRRLGGYLALLYALEGTDMHAENLVARGEEPVLVDVETLFHPQPSGKSSVRSVGILPHPVRLDDQTSVDISAFGSLGGASTPRWFGGVRHAGTDNARIERRARTLGPDLNRPSESESQAAPSVRMEALRLGFESTYRLLIAERDSWLAPGGMLDRLAEAEVRVLLRPSLVYGRLMQESFHPTLLRDALDRDRHFDRLWTVGEAAWRPLIPSEQVQLWNGDIPVFYTRPNSRDLIAPTGERAKALLKTSGLDRVRRRFLGLGEDDLARQLRHIDAAFAALD